MTDDEPEFGSSVTRSLLRRLRLALESTNTVVWELDLENRDVDYFGPVEQLTGLSMDELEDPLSVTSVAIHPDDRESVTDAFEAVLTGTAETVDVEYRTNPEHGSVRWVRTQTFFAHGEGDSSTLVGISTDVTPLKEKEQRLEEFSGIVAHDLRNPLSVAQGRLELARAEVDSEHLRPVADSLDRMERLVDDLLTLARDGEAIADREPVALDDLAESCWATVETDRAELVVETDRTILADVSRLRQLLENVFRNAVEHGGDDVTVTVGALDDGFAVEDDGDGIPEDVRAGLFKRGHASENGATGLGLKIVQQVADAHGWEVRAVEGSAGGARFEVTGTGSA